MNFKLFLEAKKEDTPTVYFDMDGVLADFPSQFMKLFNIRPEEVSDDELWKMIRKEKGFWVSMPIITGTKKLLHYVRSRGYNVEILSAVPEKNKDPKAERDKRDWINRNFKQYFDKVNIVRRKDKQRFAKKNALLIDDLEKNTKEFMNAGGLAVTFKNSSQALRDFKKFENILNRQYNTSTMPVQYDDKRILRPGTQHEWTEDMVKEFALCTKSVKHFALNHVKVFHPTKGKIPYEIRSYQMDIFDNLNDNRQNIMLLPRQSGKCCLYDVYIKVRNKKTKEEKLIKIGEMFEMLKKEEKK